MRDVHPGAQALRETRQPLTEIPLLWVESKDRTTSAITGIGFWAGEDDESISVPINDVYEPRFFRAGQLMSIGAVRHESGMVIRPVSIALIAGDDNITNTVRIRDIQGGRIWVWKRTIDQLSRKEIGVELWFRGYVNRAPITMSGEYTVELQIVSDLRRATIKSSARKSDAAQKRRNGDRFRRYKAVAARSVPWGQE